MVSELLRIEGLCVSYGKVEALRRINLSIAPGEIVTVLGPNGAGKTTLLSAIAGLLPSTGTLSWQGSLVRCPTVEGMLGRGLALVPESRELFGGLCVEDNLVLGAFTSWPGGRAASRARLLGVYEIFPKLQERRAQVASTLSGGERQMLAVGRALMGQPRLLLLDEPSLGLAPLIVKEVLKVVASLRALGVSVLLVEQNARAALAIADRGYVLEMGEIVAEGSAQLLKRDSRIAAAYLGSSVAQAEQEVPLEGS